MVPFVRNKWPLLVLALHAAACSDGNGGGGSTHVGIDGDDGEHEPVPVGQLELAENRTHQYVPIANDPGMVEGAPGRGQIGGLLRIGATNALPAS